MKKQKLAEKITNKANKARPLDDSKPLEYSSVEVLILEKQESGYSTNPEVAERSNEVGEAAIGSDEEDSNGLVEGKKDNMVQPSKEPVMEDANDKTLLSVGFASFKWLVIDVLTCIEMKRKTQIQMGPYSVSVALNGIIGVVDWLIIIFSLTNVKKTNIFVCVYVILLSILHYTVANLETMNNIGFALLIKHQLGMLSE